MATAVTQNGKELDVTI